MTRRFQSDAERQHEIARLESKRDAAAALIHPDKLSLATGLLIGGFLLWLGSMIWRTWIRPPAKGDLWGYADTIGYDGDRPREIQRKIDVLRRSCCVDK
jgi:hypothetical protein